ncbi:MAG: ankyrin repeat domain-containing protein [Candidatus Rokubacteria bacterium]|nr:ankyrin repeat domain-containing protein [Candidatus Rokubacteria bacterium]
MTAPRWARAVSAGDLEAVRRWLASGADVDARDEHGQTALMLAAHGGHAAIVEVLVASGADLDVTAKYSLSALMLAVVAGHAAVARRLVAAGADRTIEGRGAPGFAGKTAYHLARDRRMDDLAAALAPR